MGVLAHTTSTLSSILGAISTTASTVDTTITTAASGLDMMAAAITKAKAKQVIDNKLEMDTYLEEAIAEASLEHQERMERILKAAHSNPVKAKHFNEVHARLSALFAAPTAA